MSTEKENNYSYFTGGSSLHSYTDKYRKSYRPLIEYFLYIFNQGNYAFEDETNLEAYTPEQDIKNVDCHNEIADPDIHILHYHDRCRGITLDNLETIILGCPNKTPENPGCFDVFGPLYGENNEIIGPDIKVRGILEYGLKLLLIHSNILRIWITMTTPHRIRFTQQTDLLIKTIRKY